MNVLHVVVHPTVAFHNVNNVVSYVIALPAKLLVATHTLSVHVNTILHVAPLFRSVLLGVHHVHTGAVVSTVTALLHVVAAAFHAASFTLFAGNVNFTVPFTFDLAVYVNVNVLFVALHHTVALLNVTNPFVAIVISPDDSAFVATHTLSVHVSTILHVAHALINVLLGAHHLHTGAAVSLQSALNVTAPHCIVID